jgi:hypothetical protein
MCSCLQLIVFPTFQWCHTCKLIIHIPIYTSFYPTLIQLQPWGKCRIIFIATFTWIMLVILIEPYLIKNLKSIFMLNTAIQCSLSFQLHSPSSNICTYSSNALHPLTNYTSSIQCSPFTQDVPPYIQCTPSIDQLHFIHSMLSIYPRCTPSHPMHSIHPFMEFRGF